MTDPAPAGRPEQDRAGTDDLRFEGRGADRLGGSASIAGAAAPAETPAEQQPLRRPRTPRLPADRYAIGALGTALLALFPVAVVLGHIALARIHVHGVGGRGLAIAALVIGYVGIVVGLAAWTLYFAVVAPAVTLP